MKAGEVPMFPMKGTRITQHEARDLLIWAGRDQGASDITLQTGEPVWIEVHGRLRRVTPHCLDKDELNNVLTLVYGAQGVAQIGQGQDLDISYVIHLDRVQRLRYRVNVTPVTVDGHDAMQITLRVLPNSPPELATLGIERDLLAALEPVAE